MKYKIILVVMITIIAWIFSLMYALKTKPDPFVWKDENGCHYLVRADWLTPRLNPNGTQICRK